MPSHSTISALRGLAPLYRAQIEAGTEGKVIKGSICGSEQRTPAPALPQLTCAECSRPPRSSAHAQNVAAHQDHQQPACPHGNPVVDLHSVIRQRISQEVTAIQRRNRQQVEEEEREVDEDGQDAEQYRGL